MPTCCAKTAPSVALLLAFALSAALCPTAALADTILPASGLVSLGGGLSSAVYNGLYPAGKTLSYSSGGTTGVMTGANSYGSDPQVSASLTYYGTFGAREEILAQSIVDYQFDVIGPADTTVPITLAGLGAESISVGGGSSRGYADIIVYLPASPLTATFEAISCSGVITGTTSVNCDPSATSGSFNVNTTFQVATDTAYDVQVESGIQIASLIGDSTPQLYTGESSVDPTIALDTTDPAYSLEFSPAPTPEPGSLWLALTGVVTTFGAGLVKRRFDARG